MKKFWIAAVLTATLSACGGSGSSAPVAPATETSVPVRVDSPKEDFNQNLRSAAEQGDLNGIEVALSKGANLDSENSKGETALLLAIDNDRYDAVRSLVEKGANPSAADHQGITPLLLAAKHADGNAIRILFTSNRNYESLLAKVCEEKQIDTDILERLQTRLRTLSTKTLEDSEKALFSANLAIKSDESIDAKDAKTALAFLKAMLDGFQSPSRYTVDRIFETAEAYKHEADAQIKALQDYELAIDRLLARSELFGWSLDESEEVKLLTRKSSAETALAMIQDILKENQSSVKMLKDKGW